MTITSTLAHPVGTLRLEVRADPTAAITDITSFVDGVVTKLAESRRDDVTISVHPDQAILFFTHISLMWKDSKVDMRLLMQ